MRHLGVNKKGLESQVVVIIIIALIVLVILFMFSGKIIEWVNMMINRMFGY